MLDLLPNPNVMRHNICSSYYYVLDLLHSVTSKQNVTRLHEPFNTTHRLVHSLWSYKVRLQGIQTDKAAKRKCFVVLLSLKYARRHTDLLLQVVRLNGVGVLKVRLWYLSALVFQRLTFFSFYQVTDGGENETRGTRLCTSATADRWRRCGFC